MRWYVIFVALIAVTAAGCGSSSSNSSRTAAGARTPQGRAQLAACLKKQGVQFPQRPRGAAGRRGAPGGFFFGRARPAAGGGLRNPKFAAALRKCGVKPGQRFVVRGRGRFRAALTKFVACVRKNGYKLPAPNTSGNGPLFDPSKVNRTDPKLIAAVRKCQSTLPSRRQPPQQ